MIETKISEQNKVESDVKEEDFRENKPQPVKNIKQYAVKIIDDDAFED